MQTGLTGWEDVYQPNLIYIELYFIYNIVPLLMLSDHMNYFNLALDLFRNQFWTTNQWFVFSTLCEKLSTSTTAIHVSVLTLVLWLLINHFSSICCRTSRTNFSQKQHSICFWLTRVDFTSDVLNVQEIKPGKRRRKKKDNNFKEQKHRIGV